MDTGDTAWVMTSAALVLLMTPGLALFYGGMTRAKGVLNMMMMSFGAIAVVTVLWVLFGYSITFGDSETGLLGGFDNFGLHGLYGGGSVTLAVNGGEYAIPALVFASFQVMFAIITVALISGAIADRAKFLGWVVFAGLWVSIVYFPVANWVFDFGDENAEGAGWIADWGVLDFAGGTAVHVNAGAAGLALAIVLGKRLGWKRDPMRPHNLPLVLLGAGLLWFGWFGFNAGSSLGANGLAGIAFINTQAATAAAVIGWLIVEQLRDGRPTTLGAASGAVAGLVAITPACAFVSPLGALLLGLVAGSLCALAVGLKWRFGYDDSLDVVGVHLVGGAFGSIAIGFLARGDGILYGGGSAGWALLGKQTTAVLAVAGFSFVVALVLGKLIDLTIGFRVDEEDEMTGVDLSEHAESGYDLAATPRGRGLPGTPPAGAPDPQDARHDVETDREVRA